VQVDAAVDLACAQVDEMERFLWHDLADDFGHVERGRQSEEAPGNEGYAVDT
jgi:hypothetical protein